MPPEVVRAFAPGRVNLIGEHTDYNEGLCLPFAIERGVTVLAEPGPGRELAVRARDLGEEDRFALRNPEPVGGWRALVRGTVAELQAAGLELRAGRLDIGADLPAGGGLGSSAALCVALSLALCALCEAPPPERVELARLCSRVETEWAGARTGLLDQLASLCGREGHAVRIDMRTLGLDHVPVDLGGHVLAMLDSGAPRELAGSGYNRRRRECEDACAALGVASLRDAHPARLRGLPEPLARRAGHVLGENERVDRMAAALRRRNLSAVGTLLDASHRSLRDDYEVSVPPVERTVERAKARGALGARIMGGGFGGHVLALFPPGAAPVDALGVSPAAGARLL